MGAPIPRVNWSYGKFTLERVLPQGKTGTLPALVSGASYSLDTPHPWSIIGFCLLCSSIRFDSSSAAEVCPPPGFAAGGQGEGEGFLGQNVVSPGGSRIHRTLPSIGKAGGEGKKRGHAEASHMVEDSRLDELLD